jgi:hypothetical protein
VGEKEFILILQQNNMVKFVTLALAAFGMVSAYRTCGTNGLNVVDGRLYGGPVAGLNTGVGAVALDSNDINRIENMRMTNAIDRTIGGTWAGQGLMNDVNRISNAANFENNFALNGGNRFGQGFVGGRIC